VAGVACCLLSPAPSRSYSPGADLGCVRPAPPGTLQHLTGPTPTISAVLAKSEGRPPFQPDGDDRGLQIKPDGTSHGGTPLGMTELTARRYVGLITGESQRRAGNAGWLQADPGQSFPSSDSAASAFTGPPSPWNKGFRTTPAWVIIYPPASVTACSSAASPIEHPKYHHGIYRVVVLFGAVAKVVTAQLLRLTRQRLRHGIWRDRLCDEVDLSVLWKLTGPLGTTVTLRYSAPTCAVQTTVDVDPPSSDHPPHLLWRSSSECPKPLALHVVSTRTAQVTVRTPPRQPPVKYLLGWSSGQTDAPWRVLGTLETRSSAG